MRVLNIVTIILDALLLAVCAVVKLNYYITEPKFSSSGPNIYDVIWIGWMVISILITLSPMLTRIIVLCFVKYKKQLLALLIPLFVWCGDLNVAHQEIDLKNPGPNRGNAGFSDQEREKFTRLLESGFTDSFRYLYPDATGRYSWWSYRFNARKNNAGWRIDYWLLSDRLRDRILRAEIESEVFGSDHCPVLLEIADQ